MNKLCKGCNTEKPLDEFYKDKRRKDGRYSKCKQCHASHIKRVYESKPKMIINPIIADHGEWVEVDVSTKRFPDAIMKIDKDDWNMIRNDPKYGKVFALQPHKGRYMYASTNMKIGNKKYRRRMIHQIVHPTNMLVDHINLVGIHTGLDNRRCNLRTATHTTNAMNRHYFGTNMIDISINVNQLEFNFHKMCTN